MLGRTGAGSGGRDDIDAIGRSAFDLVAERADVDPGRGHAGLDQVAADREAPGHFVFYEVYANRADFEAHNAMPYVKDWFKKLPDLAIGGVKVTRMEILTNPR